MNDETTQEVLFQDPIGLRLRQGREKCGLSIEQVGQQLKLPVAIVEAMEREDWARLGAPVYVRSYLGSYLRLVGLPAVIAEQAAQAKPVPQLVSMGSRSRMRHAIDRSLRNLVYLVMTAVLVVPVVLVARHYQAGARPEALTLETDPASLVLPVDALPAPAADGGTDADASGQSLAAATPTASPSAPAVEGPAPVMASMAPFPKAAAPVARELQLRFKGESWIDVVDAQGIRVERGLVAEGAERRYAAGQVARITLGNADVVEVLYEGAAIDLAPYRAANVARFAVSSTGEPAPAGN